MTDDRSSTPWSDKTLAVRLGLTILTLPPIWAVLAVLCAIIVALILVVLVIAPFGYMVFGVSSVKEREHAP
jgi:hypothetical protein